MPATARPCQFLSRQLGALVLAGFCAGCAINDEGAVDYRRGEIPPPVTEVGADKKPVTRPGTIPESVALVGKYEPVADEKAYLTEGEYYEIKLKQGLVADFWDLPGFLSGSFEERGEVAIVVNAFEVGAAGKTLTFDPDSRRQARVIYFSADVEERQYL
ncbi:MAG: hypothetical protein JNL25_16340, partial [Rhodospirillaceae bacterium]|nr:hypothetical protein [Rhodospirillaceae bacterium]